MHARRLVEALTSFHSTAGFAWEIVNIQVISRIGPSKVLVDLREPVSSYHCSHEVRLVILRDNLLAGPLLMTLGFKCFLFPKWMLLGYCEL
jgi:hypothetical protein